MRSPIRTSPQLLSERRLDCYFYQQEFIDHARKVAAVFPSQTETRSLFSVLDGTHDSVDTKDTPAGDYTIPFLRSQDIGSGFLHEEFGAFLHRFDHEKKCKRSKIHHLDLLLNIMASTGSACVYSSCCPAEANANRAVGILRRKDSMITTGFIYFLAAWFSSSVGGRELARSLKGSIQQRLNLEDISECTIPIVSGALAKFIGEKVQQAERLRDQARSLEKQIAGKFMFLTANLLQPKKAWWARHPEIDAYRINAPHYDAVVLDMLEKASVSTGIVSLQSLHGPRGIAGGATPLGAVYPPDGAFFVRVQNVKPYRLDLSDAAYIDSATDEELKRSRCAEGDVILSITGYPGTASIVIAEDLPVNINQHSVRFDVVGDLSPEFVTAALNSPFLKRQVDRLAIGGTREALDYTSVGDLQIPVLPKADRDEITVWVTRSNSCVRAATRLTAASKILVEALIEGKVTEAELAAAQECLERGDYTADRALLSRLTRKGFDVAGEPPLFPDLDALYALLAQSESTTE